MASVKGDISAMPLTDLLQWTDLAKKTGSITASYRGTEKKIYLEDGKVVYVSSNREGERLGEFIMKDARLDAEKIKNALIRSQSMKIPFTQMLIDLGYFTVEDLKRTIIRYAKDLLMDAVSWEDGWFEFIQGIIPSYVMRGPIQLNTTELIFEVFKSIEEKKIGIANNT
jgi:Domain of unknown function (DUF4388)